MMTALLACPMGMNHFCRAEVEAPAAPAAEDEPAPVAPAPRRPGRPRKAGTPQRAAADRAAARIRATAQQEAAMSAEERAAKDTGGAEPALPDECVAPASTGGVVPCWNVKGVALSRFLCLRLIICSLCQARKAMLLNHEPVHGISAKSHNTTLVAVPCVSIICAALYASDETPSLCLTAEETEQAPPPKRRPGRKPKAVHGSAPAAPAAPAAPTEAAAVASAAALGAARAAYAFRARPPSSPISGWPTRPHTTRCELIGRARYVV